MMEQEFETLIKKFIVRDFREHTRLISISEDDICVLKTYMDSNPYIATVSVLNPGIIANIVYDIEQKVAHITRYLRYRTDRVMESELE